MPSLHVDLREQAVHLLNRDRGKPKQVNLRRAVSAAYYALFHRLTHDASRLLISGRGRTNLRGAVRRSFTHTEMAKAARGIGRLNPAQPWMALLGGRHADVSSSAQAPSVSDDLLKVARTFIDLQEKRHTADYDTTAILYREEVRESIYHVQQAFAALDTMDKDEKAVFLTALLLYGRAKG